MEQLRFSVCAYTAESFIRVCQMAYRCQKIPLTDGTISLDWIRLSATVHLDSLGTRTFRRTPGWMARTEGTPSQLLTARLLHLGTLKKSNQLLAAGYASLRLPD